MLETPSQIIEFIAGCQTDERDAAGNATAFTCGGAEPSLATYDSAGRLLTASISGSQEYEFSYDAEGRLITGSLSDGAYFQSSTLEWGNEHPTFEHAVSLAPWGGGDQRFRDGDQHRGELTRHWDENGLILDEEDRGGAELFLYQRFDFTWDEARLVRVSHTMARGGPDDIQGDPSCSTTPDFFTCETTFSYDGDTMVSFETAGRRTRVSDNCCRVCLDDG